MRSRRIEKGENGIIFQWKPDHDGVAHYGIMYTCVRLKTLDAARMVEKTVRETKQGVVYDESLADWLRECGR